MDDQGGKDGKRGDDMEKTFKKSTLPVLLAGTIALFILLSGIPGMISGGGSKDPSADRTDLETVLSEIQGVGDVRIYRQGGEAAGGQGIFTPLDGYFGTTAGLGEDTPSGGILVVAEGANDVRVRNELVRILSSVLELPEHRIVVVEMKKEGEY